MKKTSIITNRSLSSITSAVKRLIVHKGESESTSTLVCNNVQLLTDFEYLPVTHGFTVYGAS